MGTDGDQDRGQCAAAGDLGTGTGGAALRVQCGARRGGSGHPPTIHEARQRAHQAWLSPKSAIFWLGNEV